MPDITGSPAVIYAAIILGVLVMIAAAIPKILGPLAKGWEGWLESRRRTAAAAEDAQLGGLRDDNRYLSDLAADRLAEIEARNRLAAVHIQWDHQAMMGMPGLGPPPPLLPGRQVHLEPPATATPSLPAVVDTPTGETG